VKEFKRKYSLNPAATVRIKTKFRRIVTDLPVPESLSIFEKLNKYEPVSMQGQPPIIIDHSESFSVFDRWGNQWIDFSSGVLISNVGNSHPAIRKALHEMIERPLLSTYVFPHEKRVELVELLCEIFPFKGYKVFLLSTGSEAAENAIKLARTYSMEKYGPGKKYIVGFINSFHGRTMGAQLAGGMEKGKKWLGDPDTSFVHVPFPDGYKNENTHFDLFTETLNSSGIKPEEVCGVISESYQGVGPDFFPASYARNLENWCRENDVLLIMDEIQSGFGRTGKLFTFQHYGIKPDIVTCGKGISSSLPLSAVIGREDIMDLYGPGSMTSTHSGSPLPVAAAVENIKLLKSGCYIKNAEKLGPVLKNGLLDIRKKHPLQAGCVHSLGLVAGIQIVRPGTKEPDSETAFRINERCFRKGLLMFAPVGIAGECIKIAPTLDITEDALKEGISVLSEAMDEICN